MNYTHKCIHNTWCMYTAIVKFANFLIVSFNDFLYRLSVFAFNIKFMLRSYEMNRLKHNVRTMEIGIILCDFYFR